MSEPMFTIYTSQGSCVCFSEQDLAVNLVYAHKEGLRVLRVERHETMEPVKQLAHKVAS